MGRSVMVAVLVGLSVLVVLLLSILSFRNTPAAEEEKRAHAGAEPRLAADRSLWPSATAPAAPTAAPPSAPVQPLAASPPHLPPDLAISNALQDFAFVGMPLIDGCLGPVAAPRRPQLVQMRFHLADSAAPDGQRRYLLEAAEPAPGGAKPPPPEVNRCLTVLRGRELTLPADVPLDKEFVHPVSMFLPVRLATNPGGQR